MFFWFRSFTCTVWLFPSFLERVEGLGGGLKLDVQGQGGKLLDVDRQGVGGGGSWQSDNFPERHMCITPYNIHNLKGIHLLTTSRLGLSHLIQENFRNNFFDSIYPLCNCSLDIESTVHIFSTAITSMFCGKLSR